MLDSFKKAAHSYLNSPSWYFGLQPKEPSSEPYMTLGIVGSILKKMPLDSALGVAGSYAASAFSGTPFDQEKLIQGAGLGNVAAAFARVFYMQINEILRLGREIEAQKSENPHHTMK